MSVRMFLLAALALVTSCDTPEKRALRELSQAGIRPSGRALVEAVTSGETRHVRLLLDVKVHTGQRDDNGHTPLRIAVENGNLSIAIMLLEAAVAAGHPPTLAAVLRPGEILNGPEWEPALWLAYGKRNSDLARMLLNKGARAKKHGPAGLLITEAAPLRETSPGSSSSSTTATIPGNRSTTLLVTMTD